MQGPRAAQPAPEIEVGRGDDAVGNPHRALISQFEFFELMLLLKLETQFPAEQFETAVSRSTVPSPPSERGRHRRGLALRGESGLGASQARLDDPGGEGGHRGAIWQIMMTLDTMKRAQNKRGRIRQVALEAMRRKRMWACAKTPSPSWTETLIT